MSDDKWTFCFLLVHERAQMEEITVKFTQLNWNRIVRLCTSFFLFSFFSFFLSFLKDTSTVRVNCNPECFPVLNFFLSAAKQACSRANALRCSSSVTWPDVFCALKCSCSSTLAAVDRHGNLELLPLQSYHSVTVVSLMSEPLCRSAATILLLITWMRPFGMLRDKHL